MIDFQKKLKKKVYMDIILEKIIKELEHINMNIMNI